MPSELAMSDNSGKCIGWLSFQLEIAIYEDFRRQRQIDDRYKHVLNTF